MRLCAVCFLSVVGTASVWAQAAAPAPEDEIVFSNGDRLTGKLTRVAGGSVQFHSDIAGDVTISIDKVKELHTQGNYAVLLHGVPVKQSQAAKPGKIEVADSNVTVTPPSSPAETSSSKDVAYVIDEATFKKELARTPSFMDGWNGTVNLGATLVQSTQHGGTVNFGTSLVRQLPVLTFFPPRNKTIVNFQETYGQLTQDTEPALGIVGSTVKTSIMHADAERDEYISKRFFILATTSFDHNYSQFLQLQQIYGAGVGYNVFTKPKQQLDVRVDAHYEKQEFIIPSSNTNLFGSTFSENYRATLPLKLAFTESLALTPSWSDPSVYSGIFSAGLALPVWKRLAISFNTTDNYLSNPPAGATKNSFQFNSGLTYTLR